MKSTVLAYEPLLPVKFTAVLEENTALVFRAEEYIKHGI
jgi:hypothetical protein